VSLEPVAWRLEAASLGCLLLLTLLAGGVPYFFAKKRTKNLDYLREV
jgi:hypothetical protein